MIKFSVPGKIHLMGEHTVVYGKPALLAAINLRVYLSLEKTKKEEPRKKSDFYLRRREASLHFKSAQELQTKLETTIKKRFRIKTILPYKVTLNSDIPIGFGLGSSAAICAGYAACLLSYLKIPFDKLLINELAFEGEKLFHGTPSGGDNTTVVFGGLVWYRKELDNLKLFSPLPFKVHKNIKKFMLIDSGKPIESTKEMIEKVKRKLTEFPEATQEIFNHQEKLVKDLARALETGQEKEVINIINSGQENLEKLGVVGEKAQRILEKVRALGGAGKILGGGGFKDGSGMLLTYHQDPKKLLELAKNNSWKAYTIKIGEKGLREEVSG